jgi:hypothetical protein
MFCESKFEKKSFVTIFLRMLMNSSHRSWHGKNEIKRRQDFFFEKKIEKIVDGLEKSNI